MDQYPSTYSSVTTPDKLDLKFAQHNNKLSLCPEDHNSNSKPVTKTIKKMPKIKRDYVMISNSLRLELIKAVHTHGEQIKLAAKRLGINYSSAKAICQVYKREGRSGKKTPSKLYSKEPKAIRNFESTSVFISCNNKSPEEIVTDKENQSFQDSTVEWEASTEESLVVKNSVIGSYPQTSKTNEAGLVSEIENFRENWSYPAFSQNQSFTQQKSYPQDINSKKVQNTVLQPPPLQTVQSPLMSSFSPNTLIQGLIPKFPPNIPVYGNMDHIAKSQHILNPSYMNLPFQQQFNYGYACVYPQNIHIMTNQIGGVPILLNPVYSTLAQTLYPQLITYNFAYKTPHN